MALARPSRRRDRRDEVAEDRLDVALHRPGPRGRHADTVHDRGIIPRLRQFADRQSLNVQLQKTKAGSHRRADCARVRCALPLARFQLLVQAVVAILHLGQAHRHIVEAGAELGQFAWREDRHPRPIIAISLSARNHGAAASSSGRSARPSMK